MRNLDRNKREIVRDHIKTLRDGVKFTIAGVADYIDVKPKDVSNVVYPMLKMSALERETDGKEFAYIVNANTVTAYFAKYPLGYLAHRRTPEAHQAAKASFKQIRRKNRHPLVVGIDNEIGVLESKIKRLQSLRKEYAS